MFQAGDSIAEAPVGKMVGTDVRLRIFAETARAMAAGITHAAFGRDAAPPIVLRRGDAAPDFTLEASDGATYRLSDFRGHKAVVLAWFPKAFTSGCTAECRSLSGFRSAFSEASVQCFAASVDRRQTNAEFAAAFELTRTACWVRVDSPRAGRSTSARTAAFSTSTHRCALHRMAATSPHD
jgi:hypothetical protein